MNAIKLSNVLLDRVVYYDDWRVVDVFDNLSLLISTDAVFQKIEVVKNVKNWRDERVLNDFRVNFDAKKFMIFEL